MDSSLHTKYIAASCQFRTFVQCVHCLCGIFSKLIRRDPNGAVVTAYFDWTADDTHSNFSRL